MLKQIQKMIVTPFLNFCSKIADKIWAYKEIFLIKLYGLYGFIRVKILTEVFRLREWLIKQLKTWNRRRAEMTMYKFLKQWQKGNYPKAFNLTQKTFYNNSTYPGFVDLMARYGLDDVAVKVGKARAISTSSFRVYFVVILLVKGRNGLQPLYVPAEANVIAEKAPYKPSPFGTFGVNPASAVKSINENRRRKKKESRK